MKPKKHSHKHTKESAVNCRVTPLMTQQIAVRANEQGQTVSEYLRELLRSDLKMAGIIK